MTKTTRSQTLPMRLPFALFALFLVLPAGAQAACTPTTTGPQIGCMTVVYAESTYFISDCCQIGCIFSLWVYQESNGIPGLQRGDEVWDDTCGGQIRSDTIIF